MASWSDKFDERVERLNSSPASQIFAVGQSGTLVGGDVMLSKGPDDAFEAVVENVKQGIWAVTENSSMSQILLRWVSEGTIDYDNLPTTLPQPNISPLSGWESVSSYSVDSGTHGVFDKDTLDSAIEEENDREAVLENFLDVEHLVVPAGVTVQGDDGGYKLMARKHEGLIVEIRLEPNGDEGEESNEDEEEE